MRNIRNNQRKTRQLRLESLGARELMAGIHGDFNNDGIPELVAQDQGRDFLFGLQRGPDGRVNEMWQVDLPGALETNIALSCSEEDGPQLLLGTKDGSILRVQFLPTDTPPSPSSSAHHKCSSGWLAMWFLLLIFWRMGRT